MKCVGGIWLPDNEIHMVKWMQTSNVRVDGKLTYQYAKLQAAMKHVQRWRVALDIGAHVGTWSMHLAKRFKRVMAFEPVEAHRDCFLVNVLDENVTLYPTALGREAASVTFEYEFGSTGGTHIATNGNSGDAVMVPLDYYRLEDIDFIKIDVEGYERFVVEGGAATIRKFRPVMVVEQKPKGLAERYGESRLSAVTLLQSWGAKVQFEMSGDYCLVWP